MAATHIKGAILRSSSQRREALLQSKPRWGVLAGALALFTLLIAVYVASVDISATRGASITGDEPFYLLTTQSLLQDRDLDLRQQYERRSYESFFDHPSGLWRQSVPQEDGRLLSPHNPGLSVLLLPGFAVAGLLGAQVQMLVMTALAFSLAYVFVVREVGAPVLSWVSTFAVALSATSFIYATEIYPEVPAALMLVASLLLLHGLVRLGYWRVLALAVCLTLMVWLGIKYAPLAALVALVALWRMHPRGRAVFLALGGVSAAFFAWFHLWTFGALTPYSVGAVYAGDTTVSILGQHLAFLDRLYRLLGLFVDQRFGVGRWAPILLLAVPALVLLWRRGAPSTEPTPSEAEGSEKVSGHGLTRLVLGLVITQVLMATFVAITMMGWWFPGRTLMAVLPLLALPLAFLLVRLPRWGRVAAGLLGAYTIAITAALARAGHAREIVIAVDPFEMASAVFHFSSVLFPDYSYWNLETWGLTAAWLLVIGVAALVLYRSYPDSDVSHRSRV